mgnify:CR=1 FL=1
MKQGSIPAGCPLEADYSANVMTARTVCIPSTIDELIELLLINPKTAPS